MPNGTYGGVRGRKMKVGGNDYIIFLLLDGFCGINEKTALEQNHPNTFFSLFITFGSKCRFLILVDLK